MVDRPPWQKIARTPMTTKVKRDKKCRNYSADKACVNFHKDNKVTLTRFPLPPFVILVTNIIMFPYWGLKLVSPSLPFMRSIKEGV